MSKTVTAPAEETASPDAPGYHEISELAHQMWLDRGSPDGSPEEDWYRAEQLLGA
jgi:hypothetical protein